MKFLFASTAVAAGVLLGTPVAQAQPLGTGSATGSAEALATGSARSNGLLPCWYVALFQGGGGLLLPGVTCR